ncbi:hypothetical protein ACFOLC_04420 [Lysobacter cavernae]|uniref:Uncharacterized protein n=1 Tax=Lysobacter cavernae TaxID=1685901 RepID=A0ABV7RN45_9GAMM
MRKMSLVVLLLLCAGGVSAQEGSCVARVDPRQQAPDATMLGSIGQPQSRHGMGTGAGNRVLMQALAQSQWTDDTLASARLGDCQPVAFGKRRPATTSQGDGEGYKPKTKHDNTPYRFNMHQNGRRMSADEFDAWMKSRGIRVAKGTPAKKADTRVAKDRKRGQ